MSIIKKDEFEENNLIYNERYYLQNEKDMSKLLTICHALDNEIRLDMLKRIMEKPYKIPDLVKLYNISNSSVLFHINILREANLIFVVFEPSKKGKVQVCYQGDIARISLDLTSKPQIINKKMHTIEIPIGQYIDIAGDLRSHYLTDACKFEVSPFLPDRIDARIILIYKSGYITYALPNEHLKNKDVEFIEISFEICSEAPVYINNWRSDLALYINDLKLCDYTCSGDFGDRIGHATTSPLPLGTQYGQMVTLKISNNGVFINETSVNKELTLQDLNLAKGNKFTFKIECPENGEHVGGFNLFSKTYGDYAQDIKFTIVYF